MGLDARKLRKMLATAVVALLAATPAAATSPLECTPMDYWNGLFCNDGSQINFCDWGGGSCTVDCGSGLVGVDCP